jgi:type IV pilus assembly protein PilA
MFCSKCGTSTPDASPACPQCGASTADTPRSSAPPPSAAAPAPVRQSGPQPQRYFGPQQTDGKAVGSLILGILAIFPFGLVAGIPAVVLGHISKSSIAKSMGRLKGDGMATAGLIMGYISVAFVPLVLIIAAIAIPNLLRARMAANEAAAASTVRAVSTAQMTYSTTYPSGYAPSLAVLGPGESRVNCSDPAKIDAQHACLIERALACSETWCTKGGYRFNVKAVCGDDGVCKDYVATAMPIAPGTTGQKSFCSTNDGIIRFRGASRTAGAIVTPLTAEECQSWPMIQ